MVNMKGATRSHLWKLPISLILCQLAGVVGSIFTRPAIANWYWTLKKPYFTPPDWLFAPVWITLYFLMGISLFLIWQKDKGNPQVRGALFFFFIQLILNALWSILFFGLRSPLSGLIEILFLWVAILLTMERFARISRTGAFLLLPYFVWVSLAVLLNFSIWILNR